MRIYKVVSYIIVEGSKKLGKEMRFSDFRKKEVISIKECKRLGHVCDMEFDECKGCILKIMVPGCSGIWGRLTDDSVIVIPFCCIKQIGADLILVDI